MRAKITKTCSVRLNGEIRELVVGETIRLSPEKLNRLIDGGYAEPLKPGIDEYRDLVRELGKQDPGGSCWEWITANRHAMWRAFLTSFRNGDFTGARKHFDEMIIEWKTGQAGR